MVKERVESFENVGMIELVNQQLGFSLDNLELICVLVVGESDFFEHFP